MKPVGELMAAMTKAVAGCEPGVQGPSAIKLLARKRSRATRRITITASSRSRSNPTTYFRNADLVETAAIRAAMDSGLKGRLVNVSAMPELAAFTTRQRRQDAHELCALSDIRPVCLFTCNGLHCCHPSGVNAASFPPRDALQRLLSESFT